MPRLLYAVILRQATNLGLSGMARASQFSYPHALKPMADARPGGSRVMVLATPEDEQPHPLDWLPETAFHRLFVPAAPPMG
jgi:hypothetical protein